MSEKIEELKERIKNGFGINRVPEKTKKRFFEFSEEEFCGDRGMALKYLMDFYDGLIPTGVEHLEIAIAELEKRVADIEAKLNEEKPKPKKRRLDGTEVE